MTLRTLNYGNYGIFLIMGNAGFCPSTVVDVRSSFVLLPIWWSALGGLVPSRLPEETASHHELT